jgi:alkylation response protein AidB-like acyl-CoA dehydrogenase
VAVGIPVLAGATIYGGTAEIQRNIIARRLLDLGKE